MNQQALLAESMFETYRKNFRRNDESIEEVLVMLAMLTRNDAVRIPNYYEKVIPRYPDDTFKRHFRLTRYCVEKLLCFISDDDVFKKKQAGGREMIAVEKQLLIFLWYSGNHGTIRSGNYGNKHHMMRNT